MSRKSQDRMFLTFPTSNLRRSSLIFSGHTEMLSDNTQVTIIHTIYASPRLYDISRICYTTQKYLSPLICFRYLHSTCIDRYNKYLHILTVLRVPAVLGLPGDGGGEEADQHGGQPAHAARHQAGPHRVATTRGGRLCHTTRHDSDV